MNEEILTTLNKILPEVERVHGDHHPELHQVVALYAQLKEVPAKKIFQQLRQVTGDYTVPEDACPTYAKTYQLLAELDKAFG